MPARNLPQPESPHQLPSCRQPGSSARSLPAILSVFAALLAAHALLPGAILAAQTAPAPPALPAQKPAAAGPNNHSTAARPATATAPAQPKPPDWPVNDKPSEASVVWDSHGLRIVASNSSLAQILKDVSAKTGATLEGMAQDERIFGAYGPGPARDVLSQLLDGSGYNVLMIGDQGQGTPRRIVLSARPAGTAQPSGNNSQSTANDEDTDTEPQPQPEPQPAPVREGPAPAVPVRTPQQILQETQQPQQQSEQQRQQNPQN